MALGPENPALCPPVGAFDWHIDPWQTHRIMQNTARHRIKPVISTFVGIAVIGMPIAHLAQKRCLANSAMHMQQPRPHHRTKGILDPGGLVGTLMMFYDACCPSD